MRRFGRGLAALWRDESGSVVLETVLVFPLQLMVMLWIVQIAMIYAGSMIVQYAAFQSARSMMLAQRTPRLVDDPAAMRAGYMTAVAIVETIHNPTVDQNRFESGRVSIRTLDNHYWFRRNYGNLLTVRAGDTPLGPESERDGRFTEVGATVVFYMPLVVPLAGESIGAMMRGGRPVDGYAPVLYTGTLPRYRLVQAARVIKPWPN